jgi:hypothetical protein
MIQDILSNVLYYLSPNEFGRVSSVSQSWTDAAALVQIKAINGRKYALKKLPTAKKTVDHLITNPHCIALEYANFHKVKDFDNKCLTKLATSCPNIKHLSLGYTAIEGDALKATTNLPLLSLDLTACQKLVKNALKSLSPHIENLNLFQCTQLESDGLQNLLKLKSLDISWCLQFEKDVLERLSQTLQDLNISWCKQIDELGTLSQHQNLRRIKASWCTQILVPPELVQKMIFSEESL